MTLVGLRERLGAFFGSGEAWERPGPTVAQRRGDVWLGLAMWAVAALVTELLRIMGVLDAVSAPVWAQHMALASGTLVLVVRRRFPVAVAAFAGVHLFVVGVTMPVVMSTAPLQVAYFLAVFSAVAWARDRQLMAVVVGSLLVLIFLWLAGAYALGSGLEEMLGPEARGHPVGPVTPALAAGVYGFLVNAAYFGGAVGLGQQAWRAARHTAQVAEQKQVIQEQADRLREQAVTEERLRIARELHDVVAHHVSVMGVQAAAARAVLGRDPDRSAEALRSIEQSSREAVTQMRGLLGTLRQGGGPLDETAGRAPLPGLGDLPSLIESTAAATGLAISYGLVEESDGLHAEAPPQVALAVYRIVQEALTNVHRHSTAAEVSVVVRVTTEHVEAEVVDDGRPRGAGTSGSGLGLLGVRERIRMLGGSTDIGPRLTGGYRVRVRFPLALRAVPGLATGQGDRAADRAAGGAA